LVTCIPVGCIGLDDRTLELAKEGEGGGDGGSASGSRGGSGGNAGEGDEGGAPSAAGEAGASSASGGSSGGTGAAPGWAGAPPVDCTADIDFNQIPDCEETLLENAGFDLDIDGWTVQEFASLVWDFSDGSHSFSSGSISVTNIALSNDGQGSAAQCLQVEPGAKYLAHVQGFIPGGQTQGSARLEALQYASDDCSGDASEVEATSSEMVQEWVLLQSETTTAESTRSLLFQLVAQKPQGAPYFQVLFDNALLKAGGE
jgi:hypothetical protein